jgi:hypothetical protein
VIRPLNGGTKCALPVFRKGAVAVANQTRLIMQNMQTLQRHTGADPAAERSA